jgi:hypothetical protein
MKTEPPPRDDVMRAVDVYLSIAYDGDPTTIVKSMLATLKTWGGPFYRAPVFAAVASASGGAESPRYAMRLGNRGYPHMKLVLEPAPDGSKYLFKADTHDRHICPTQGTPEYEPFVDLMKQNQELAEEIETAWSEQGLPTFKAYLREDLARRKGK